MKLDYPLALIAKIRILVVIHYGSIKTNQVNLKKESPSDDFDDKSTFINNPIKKFGKLFSHSLR